MPRVSILTLLLFILAPAPALADAAARERGTAALRAGDDAGAFEILAPLADAGDAEAQFLVGLLYAQGRGVTQNFWQAGRYYRSAGEQGHAGAQVNLGSLYENCYGNGPCNSEAAAAWYRRAADQDHPTGLYNLATMYASGHGVAEDEWSARVLMRKAAELGHAPAQYNLGVIYERGMGGPVQVVDAFAWYDTAARAGFEEAEAARERVAASLDEASRSAAAALAERIRTLYLRD